MVANILGMKARSFMKTSNSKVATDDYGAFHVFFNAEDLVEAVEVFHGEIEVLYDDDKNLFDLGKKEVTALLFAHDPDCIVESDGLIAKAIGLSVYAPKWQGDEADTIDSILAFERGYYDGLL